VTNRRQFMQTGVALAAYSLIASPGADLKPARFVYDSRFAPARHMARRMAQQGVALAATSGDLTDLWFNEFDLQWRQAPMVLAGMTTVPGLFVLETLAADHRMRVVSRLEHAAHGIPASDALVAWVIAPRVVRS
jgi:hypothetical protein